jgi:hypothetical protein
MWSGQRHDRPFPIANNRMIKTPSGSKAANEEPDCIGPYTPPYSPGDSVIAWNNYSQSLKERKARVFLVYLQSLLSSLSPHLTLYVYPGASQWQQDCELEMEGSYHPEENLYGTGQYSSGGESLFVLSFSLPFYGRLALSTGEARLEANTCNLWICSSCLPGFRLV